MATKRRKSAVKAKTKAAMSRRKGVSKKAAAKMAAYAARKC